MKSCVVVVIVFLFSAAAFAELPKDVPAAISLWSKGAPGSEAMNDRKYALYFYWGPFGHASNSAQIMKVNDLIDSFDWLSIRKNEGYAVITNSTGNSKLPWPDDLKSTAADNVAQDVGHVLRETEMVSIRPFQ